MNLLIETWQNLYSPLNGLSGDEISHPFKGRSKLKQYMPIKIHKWMIKEWAVVCSETRYITNFNIYPRTVSIKEDHAPNFVLCQLTSTKFNKNSLHFTCNNYFSSIPMALSMADYGYKLIRTF